MSAPAPAPVTTHAEVEGFVTAKLASHWFALPISAVQEIFVLSKITDVPHAPPATIGVLNLRGRVVTALDTRQILGFAPALSAPTLAVGVERGGELFGLAVDAMGEVLRGDHEAEAPPMNLDRRWRDLVTGVTRHNGTLVLIVAVDCLFDGIQAAVTP